jgi:hypothetical protein
MIKSINVLLIFYYGIFCFVVYFCVFFGLRGFVYTDWLTYVVFYNEIPVLSSGWSIIRNFLTNSEYALAGWEKGFIIYSICMKSISIDYFGWQFLFVLTDFIVLMFVFQKYVSLQNSILCFLLYGGFLIEFNLLRNAKSLLFFYASIKYLHDRRPMPYICLNLVGCLFHTSSLVFIPCYFLFTQKYSIRFIFCIYLFANIVFLFHIPWIMSAGEFVLRIVKLERILTVLKIYMKGKSYGITFAYLQRTIEFFLIFFIAMKYVPYGKYYYLYNMFFLYHFCYLLFSEILVFVERFPILLVSSYWLLLPKLFENIKYKKLFLLFFLVLGLVVLGKSNSRAICIYDNYLFDYMSYDMRKNIMHEFYGQQ